MRLNCLQLRLVHRAVSSLPSPATNATADLDASTRRGSVNYMVDHICEPMPSTGSHLPNYAARCKMGERHRLRPNRRETI